MKNKINILCLLLFFGAMFFQVQLCLSATPHNIAIAAAGDSVNSEISMIAGKAPYYLIFDENGVFFEIHRKSRPG
jgi:hypothetical protein